MGAMNDMNSYVSVKYEFITYEFLHVITYEFIHGARKDQIDLHWTQLMRTWGLPKDSRLHLRLRRSRRHLRHRLLAPHLEGAALWQRGRWSMQWGRWCQKSMRRDPGDCLS
jgi:hypothetical protein